MKNEMVGDTTVVEVDDQTEVKTMQEEADNYFRESQRHKKFANLVRGGFSFEMTEDPMAMASAFADEFNSRLALNATLSKYELYTAALLTIDSIYENVNCRKGHVMYVHVYNSEQALNTYGWYYLTVSGNRYITMDPIGMELPHGKVYKSVITSFNYVPVRDCPMLSITTIYSDDSVPVYLEMIGLYVLREDQRQMSMVLEVPLRYQGIENGELISESWELSTVSTYQKISNFKLRGTGSNTSVKFYQWVGNRYEEFVR